MEAFSDSDSDKDLIAIGITAIILKKNEKQQRRLKKKRYWVNPYLLGRTTKGRFTKDDMRNFPRVFFENFHVSPPQFDKLLDLVRSILLPLRNARPEDFISPVEKLCLTLEFLASGYCSDMWPQYTESEPNEESWRNSANNLYLKWNMPNCLGSVDGKHVAIKCTKNAETTFFNHKGFHSIILMAVADADCKFTYFDVGAYGSEADGQVFRSCELGKKMNEEPLSIPNDATVYGKKISYFFVADDAFPVQKNILKSYKPSNRGSRLQDDERIFNYRLSRARRTVENCFGVLCARWICLARTMFVNLASAQKIVAACCVLHNYSMTMDKQMYCPPGFEDVVDENGDAIKGSWRKLVPEDSMNHSNLPTQNSERIPSSAKEVCDHIKTYANSDAGSLEW